jgi:TolA-binding protein
MIDQWHLQRCLREFENHINQLTREVNSLRQFQESAIQEKQIKAVLEILTRAQTGQMAYTNLIIVAGYAGFLTFWSSLSS